MTFPRGSMLLRGMCFLPQPNKFETRCSNIVADLWSEHKEMSEWIKYFSPLCNIWHLMPDLQMEYGSASAFCYRQNVFLASIWEPAPLWMLFACFKDMRLDSCMSDSLSFVNKSNLCLILFSSSSKISDNHSGPHWGWKNHHAGIRICTICDGESCVVMDQSHTLQTHTIRNIYIYIYKHTNANIYKESISSFSLYHRCTGFSFLLQPYMHRYSTYTPRVVAKIPESLN